MNSKKVYMHISTHVKTKDNIGMYYYFKLQFKAFKTKFLLFQTVINFVFYFFITLFF